jgi:hypothetical protein
VTDQAAARRQRFALVLALAGMAGVVAVLVFMIRQPPVTLVIDDCRGAYARSHSAADSTITDARLPATPNGKPSDVSCGTLRQQGRLAP